MSRGATFTAERQCEHCATPFTLSNPNQKFCAEDCRLRHHFGPPRPCGHCQTIFQPRWKANDYCCTPCHDLAQRRSPDLVCEQCGVTFRRPDTLSKAYQPRYCSWACLSARKLRHYVCQQCGVAYTRTSARKPSRFCSYVCAGEARRSGTPRRNHVYDRQYRAWRAAVLERDKVCRHCGASDDLNAHHIYGWTDFPERRYDVDNGLLLCRACHQLRHPTNGVGGLRRYGRSADLTPG